MASKRFKKVFLLRFVTYLMLLTGFLTVIGELEPVVTAEFNFRKDQLFGVKHRLANSVITSGQSVVSPPGTGGSSNGFGDLQGAGGDVIKPVSTEYGIVIEKINANSLVLPDINPGDEQQYVDALSKGVAEAAGSTKPGKPGNLYIFSHSTDAPWNVARFNAVFYLLRELEAGDQVVIFYQGRRYNYIVYDKSITPPSDLTFLTNRYDKPVLTLQTCDPPGTLLNRLIVRARLQGS